MRLFPAPLCATATTTTTRRRRPTRGLATLAETNTMSSLPLRRVRLLSAMLHCTLVAWQLQTAAAQSCTSYLMANETLSRCYDYSSIPATSELDIFTAMLFVYGHNLTVLPSSADTKPQLRTLPDPGLARLKLLKLLDLSSNQVSTIYSEAFSANLELTSLNLDNNLLMLIPPGIFKRLSKLQNLNLARNAITSVGRGDFAYLINLQHLNLSSNRINRVDVGAFEHLNNLRELSLANNELTTLSEALSGEIPPMLTMMHLGRNPFHCDCSLLWLKTLLTPDELPTGVKYDRDELACHSSPVPGAAGQKWVHLRYSQFACTPEILHPPVGTVLTHTVTAGSSATLTCRVLAHPKNAVSWMRAGTDLSIVGGKYSTSFTSSYNFSATLSIHNLQISDSGSYACATRNEAGSVLGNFTLVVQTSQDALDALELDVVETGLWAVLADKGDVINFLTVVGASVCAFLFIITIISTIVYCLTAAKSKRRKSRRVLATKPYAKGANGVANGMSDKLDVTRPQPVTRADQYQPIKDAVYTTTDAPHSVLLDESAQCEVLVDRPDCQSVASQSRVRSTATLQRQVTFAETCPVHGGTSVAVVQPLVNGNALQQDCTNAAHSMCPVHGNTNGMYATLQNGSHVLYDSVDYNAACIPNGTANNSVNGNALGNAPHATLIRLHNEDATANRQQYLSLKQAITSPTRQLSIHDQFALQALSEQQVTGRFNAADRQYSLNSSRCGDDEGYNTAV